MAQTNKVQGMEIKLPHSELYYSLIRAKQNSSIFNKNNNNNTYTQSLLVGRGGGQMLSPDSQHEIREHTIVENSLTSFKCTEEENRIKQLIWIHLENIPLLQSAPMSQVWAETPPPKMDKKKKYTKTQETEMSRNSALHNLGNKINLSVTNTSAFDECKKDCARSIGTYPGLCDVMSLHANLLFQVLVEHVYFDPKLVDPNLLFKKLKLTLNNQRANKAKAE
jgi:hypothetical protein